MHILLIYALRIIFMPLALTQTGIRNVCEFAGGININDTNFKFSIDDLPERCDAILYGNYMIDGNDVEESRLYKNDEAAIKSLAGANKTVFSYVTYTAVGNWYEFFEPKDPALYTERVGRLTQTINDFGISGIIIGIDDLYDGTTDYANKISVFIKKLKKNIPTLKFGLPVDGTESYEKIPNKELFDFSILNPLMDIYIIKSKTRKEFCTPEGLRTGTLITSLDPKTLTLEKIGNAVKNSTMDKNKTFAKTHVVVEKDAKGYYITPYSQYCDNANSGARSSWCAENAQKFYSIVNKLKIIYEHCSVTVKLTNYGNFRNINLLNLLHEQLASN